VYEALEARRATEKERAEAEIRELSAGLDESRNERAALAAKARRQLAPAIRDHPRAQEGPGRGRDRGGTCEGCHMRVAPQLAIEIHRNTRVIACRAVIAFSTCARPKRQNPPRAGC